MRTLTGALCAAGGAVACLLLAGLLALLSLLLPGECGAHPCGHAVPPHAYAAGSVLALAAAAVCAGWLIVLLAGKCTELRRTSRTDLQSSVRPIPMLPQRPEGEWPPRRRCPHERQKPGKRRASRQCPH